MASVINTITSSVEVTEVESVVVTDIADDGTGKKIRAIKVYGRPLGTEGSPVFTLLVSSQSEDKVKIKTPELPF
ncbi:hypothetical protein [uncultured Methylobacterium sp.]|jgi:hypothetical protein|uniref:hypothetical protein n=1 Tax=uncultured Methylobacterium sp. TaxID=157278 RepID=UPI0026241DEC|nr:hypothetical protein [uncultured Methylobacterium sp.]